MGLTIARGFGVGFLREAPRLGARRRRPVGLGPSPRPRRAPYIAARSRAKAREKKRQGQFENKKYSRATPGPRSRVPAQRGDGASSPATAPINATSNPSKNGDPKKRGAWPWRLLPAAGSSASSIPREARALLPPTALACACRKIRLARIFPATFGKNLREDGNLSQPGV